MKDYLEIKKQLFALCEKYVDEKIKTAQEAIDNAQKSANHETKSSSGDKYETSRAMMHLEIEKFSAQLNDGINLKRALSQIDINKKCDTVKSGSLVITNQGNYFISISAGKLSVNEKEYMAISYSSPIGQVIFNKMKNDEFYFREKRYLIRDII